MSRCQHGGRIRTQRCSFEVRVPTNLRNPNTPSNKYKNEKTFYVYKHEEQWNKNAGVQNRSTCVWIGKESYRDD